MPPRWWQRQEIIPCQLPVALKSYLKLNQTDSKEISIASGVIIDESAGEVLIGSGTRICHGAVIQGPAIIGANCLVGNYVFIRPGTMLGNNVRVGFATEIKNALIESETVIGPQCFISDSVIDREVYIGAQVRTSNHRLDHSAIHVHINGEHINTGLEKLGCYIGPRTRIGVQVIILPGRYIMADTLVGPRITIEHNLKKGKYILKQEILQTEGEK
ncbi:acetyltransferase [Superficieibacter sp. 1612_C1]|uniref:acetyltransferase n=1 Tax=Superficieibacter sp. 1612_C1 TaxID=2780382 RepID=UPI0018841033|nr:acetyltransferase [Superficieibacter sp. 1612_C1]